MAQWHYSKDGQQQGPVSPEQLKQLAATGELQPTDLVWKEGMSQWVAASSIKSLFAAPSLPTPPMSPPTVPGQDARSSVRPFGEWYRTIWLGRKPILLQALMWLFYGFLWIPGWYFWTATPPGSLRAKWSALGFGGKLAIAGLACVFCLLVAQVSQVRHASSQGTGQSRQTSPRPRDSSRSVSTQPSEETRHPNVVSQKEVSESWSKIGTLQSMGQRFSDDLPYAKLDPFWTSYSPRIVFTEEFCPNGKAKFRMVKYGNNWTNEWAVSAGIKVEDEVSEGTQVMDYFVTSGDPRYICLHQSGSSVDLPRLKIGAKPGDEWRYEWPVHPPGEQPVSFFRYTSNAHWTPQCVCIHQEDRNFPAGPGNSPGVVVGYTYRWYAKGIGLVREDKYIAPVLGTTGKPPELMSTMYRIGK